VEQVELLIMKGLSQGLVKGRIDEVGTATFKLLSIVTSLHCIHYGILEGFLKPPISLVLPRIINSGLNLSSPNSTATNQVKLSSFQ
jgi:hypothetical protein